MFAELVLVFAIVVLVLLPIGLIAGMLMDDSPSLRSDELEGYGYDAYDDALDILYILSIYARELFIPIITAPFRFVWWIVSGGFMNKRVA